MKIYCSCCDKVQPVRVDDCLDAKTNEPFQDIVCNECDLVIASGTGITAPPSLEAAVGTAYKTGWEHGKAKERESCAKLCEQLAEDPMMSSGIDAIYCAEAIRERSNP